MKRFLLSFLFVIFTAAGLFSQEDPIIRPGELRIDIMPQLHLIANSPVSGWAVTNIGRDKVFKQRATEEAKLRFSNGEYIFTDLWFMPMTGLKLNLGFELTMDYADTYYHPINIEHRIQENYFKKFTREELDQGIDFEQIKERIRLWRSKVEYKNPFLQTRLYTGYGHGSWEYEGDMFGFYPEQWDLETYRRVSGRPVPTAVEADWNMNFGGKSFGKLSLAAGSEPVWGNKWSYYAKYSYKIRLWVPTILFKYENIDWGTPNEYLWAGALTTKYYGLRRIPLEGGILFQPFRVNREYTYTHATDPGEGYGSSDYYIGTKKTDYWDALGFKVKGNTDLVPFFSKTTLTYSFLGKLAGNMQKWDLETEKKFPPYYSLYWQNIYRQPIESAEVRIYEGTGALSPGQPVTTPRDRYDAFWVNSKNRTAFISSIFLVFDPTPATWIYRYYPNLVDLWNLNPYEKTPFSFIFNYKLSYYPGTTDLEPYKNSQDQILWPGEFDTTVITRLPNPEPAGLWPMTRPVHFFTIVGMFSIFENGLVICMVKAGEEVATAAIAYHENTLELVPMTRMFNPSLTFIKYPFYFSVEYGHNVWGPEQWYKDLGAAVDEMYKASVKYNINKNNELEFAYVGTRETDGKFYVAKIAPYDEFRLSYKGTFGARLDVYSLFRSKDRPVKKPAVEENLEDDLLSEEPVKEEPKKEEPAPAKPQLSLAADKKIFSPDNDGVLDEITLEPKLSGQAELKEWTITITDDEKKVVKVFSGKGAPPARITWNGAGKDNAVIPQATVYAAVLSGISVQGVEASSAPLALETDFYLIKTDRGLMMNLEGLEFDSGKAIIREVSYKTLNRAVQILSGPTIKNRQARVEGHTDDRGDAKFNLTLSKDRARAVMDYLTGKGIAQERLSSDGFGSAKPMVPNNTRENRQKNRRVEIIILK